MTRRARRAVPTARLREVFDHLATAIASDEVRPSPEELRAIRQLCRERGIPMPDAIARLVPRSHD
jgi:hypothetical protein